MTRAIHLSFQNKALSSFTSMLQISIGGYTVTALSE